MKVRHCSLIGNNQEKNIPSKEMNSRSLEEYKLCCINASKKKNHQNDSRELDLHLKNVQN